MYQTRYFSITGNRIVNLLRAMFPSDELWNIFHWSGTIKGIHGNQVLKPVRFKILQVSLHSCRFKLKNSGCLAFAEEFKGFFIIERQIFNVQISMLLIF
jgi:hypothetical protein